MSITIQRLGHQGDGIADGPIYAARTLPGEVIGGDIQGDRIATPKIISPSADRVTPPCRHYKSCGGCALQHASDSFVADWKQNVVRTALAAQGIAADLQAVQTSPANSRRRAVFSARRSKKGAMIGFHMRGSNTIIEIPDCQLLHPDLLAAVPALQELTMLGATRKSELRINVTKSNAGVDVAVEGVKPAEGQMLMDLAALGAKHRLARLTWEGELVAQIRPPAQTFGVANVIPPAAAFLQATKVGEQALLNAVQGAVQGTKNIVDLFAGCGTFSLPLAKDAQVHAVEGSRDMLAALDQGWRQATGLKRITTEVRDLFRRPMLADELQAYGAVLIDPPRAGAEQQFKQLAEAKPAIIAAISCNPVTFARDAKILTNAGYKIGKITVVDQFRWSSHVEMLAVFTLT